MCIRDSSKLVVKFIPSATREFISVGIKCDGNMDSNDIKKAVRLACEEGKQKNIYRVVFTGLINPYLSLAAAVDDIKDEFYCLCYQDRTAPDYDIKKLYQDNKDNIVGKFIVSLMEDAVNDPVAYKALIAGLDALLTQEGGAK